MKQQVMLTLASLEVISNSAKKEIEHKMQKDVVIVFGGANNVSKNESSKGLSYVTQFMQNRRNTNVIILNAPNRFDSEESSCVNKEIKVRNRKLNKITKRYNHTEVNDMSINRDHYTKHGLHMNKSGKEWLLRRTADSINKLFEYLKPASIILEWKESLMEGNQPEAIGHKDNNLKTGQQEV